MASEPYSEHITDC